MPAAPFRGIASARTTCTAPSLTPHHPVHAGGLRVVVAAKRRIHSLCGRPRASPSTPPSNSPSPTQFVGEGRGGGRRPLAPPPPKRSPSSDRAITHFRTLAPSH